MLSSLRPALICVGVLTSFCWAAVSQVLRYGRKFCHLQVPSSVRGLLISLKEALICVGVLSGYTAGYLCAEQVVRRFSSGVGSCRQQVQEAAALAGA